MDDGGCIARDSQVQEELTRLEEAADALASIPHTLENRLCSVLREPDPQSPGDVAKQGAEELTPLASRIRCVRMIVGTVVRCTGEIQARMEL